ncbi:MAG: 50S ribosomal protein L14 [Patescibacteria group bacterium]
MVQHRSMIKVADNSGAKLLQVIRVLGGYRKRYSRIGDIMTCVVKIADPHAAVKKSDVVHAVLVRSKNATKRINGTVIRFDENAAVIIDKKTREPKGTRIFGPVARELRAAGFPKIISLAPEVL